jgi:2-oxoglutarate ferredoxin oxidoreductase subunit alpha
MVELLQGNEACVKGALAAGCRFYAGYPITPSSEIAEMMAVELPKRGGVFIQMEDEIGSIAAVIGASLAGARAMTATSGPGISLMAENIGFAIMAEIPCVIVDVQRVGPSTGHATKPSQGDVMMARWGTHGDHRVVVLSPSSVSDMFWLTFKAFRFAEMLRTPVILLSDEIIGHMRTDVELPDEVEEEIPELEDVPSFHPFGGGKRYHVTGLVHDETGFPTNDGEIIEKQLKRLIRKIERHRDKITIVERLNVEDADVVILAYGCVVRSAIRAMYLAREEGIKCGVVDVKTLWPFPYEVVESEFKLIVPEMNSGLIADDLRKVRNDVISITKMNGEIIYPHEILEIIRRVSN